MKEQEELFGPVASLSTAWRASHATCRRAAGHPEAVARAREKVWAAAPPRADRSWTSTPPWSTSTRKRRRRLDLQAGFGFHPSGRGATRPTSRWARCATGQRRVERRRRPPGTAGPACALPPSTAWATSKATTPLVVTRSSCGPTRPAPPTASSRRSPKQHRVLDRLSRQLPGARRALAVPRKRTGTRHRVRRDDPRGRLGGRAHRAVDLADWPEGTRVICRRENPTPAPSSAVRTLERAAATPASSPSTEAPTSPTSSCATVATPGSRTGCAPGRTAATEPALRWLRPEPGLGGGLLGRRSPPGVERR